MIIYAVLTVALGFFASPPARPDPITNAQIRSAYTDLLRVVIMARPGSTDSTVFLDVAAPPDSSFLAGFIRDYRHWFSYLLRNSRSYVIKDLDAEAPGVARALPGHRPAEVIRDELARRVETDSQLSAILVPAVGAYLRRHGRSVDSDVQVPRTATVAMDTALATAVRFFYPDLIVNGKILTHVCTTLNGIRELPSRHPALEALAFSAIMRDIMRGDSSVLEPDFAPARKLVAALSISESDSVRLRRAQGATWALMSQSARLRQILEDEARRIGDLQPIVLVAK